MKTAYWCEKCYKRFDDERACLIHETSCEDYNKGDRVEVFYEGKWWPGTVITVDKTGNCEHCGGKTERFMVVRTDEQFDKDVDGPMYTGHDMGIWEGTGDMAKVRPLGRRTPPFPAPVGFHQEL